MIFVDAGADQVTIGSNASYGATLGVNGNIRRGAYTNLSTFNSNNDVIAFNYTIPVASSTVTPIYSGSVNAGGSFIHMGSGGHGTLDFRAAKHGTDSTAFTYTGAGKYLSLDPATKTGGTLIVNQDSQDIDFRVESDSYSHMLFVDAGNNNVGIQLSAPQSAFHINENGGPQSSGDMTTGLIVSNGTAGTAIQMGTNDASGFGYIKSAYVNSSQTGRALLLYTGTTKAVSLETGETVINDDSLDRDFRVESDGNTHALFVQGNDGNVGINESAPDAQLHILGTNATNGATIKLQEANNNTSDNLGTILFGNNVDDSLARVQGYTHTNNTTSALYFGSTNTATNVRNLDLLHNIAIFNENGDDIDFRVESDSNTHMLFVDGSTSRVALGRHNPQAKLDINAGTEKGIEIALGTTSVPYINFLYGATTVGSITTTGSATAYNTSSDYRLKENIADADDSGELIDAIQVRQFDWIEDGEHQRYGMVAQELNTVAPEAVFEGETEEDMMGVDYSKLVPMLVKALQEARQEINNLKSRVEQLESQ